MLPALALLVSQPCHAGRPAPYVISDGFTLSEPVSLSSLLTNQGKGDYVPGDHIWAWCRVEVGVRKDNLSFGVFQRYDYHGNFSEDTAEIVGLIANKQDLPTGREFDLSFAGTAFHARGFIVGYQARPYSWLNLRAGINYLYSDMIIDGGFRGKATVLSDKDYDYKANVNYRYTEDVLFDRTVTPATGQGYSLDMMARLFVSASLYLDLEITDLAGRIYWKNLPYTDAVASSDRKEYDENGYVHVDPVLTGYEGYHRRYTQILPSRSLVRVSQSLFSHTLFAENHHQYHENMWALGHTYRMASLTTLIKYWPENRSVTLGMASKHVSFEFTADHVDMDKVRVFAFTMSVGAIPNP